MPQVCGHFVVAEKVKQALSDPAYLEQNKEAMNLGAIGPDLFLMLFDTPDSDKYQKFLNQILSFYDTIHSVRELFDEVTNKLLGPAADLAEWIIGPLGTQVLDIAKLSFTSTLEIFKLGLIPETGPMQIDNPFAGMGVPGIPDGDQLTVEASDLSKILRKFGHPYSEDPGYKKKATPGTYKDWWWMDILHYRRTVPFARALLKNSDNDDLLKAYSIGYFSHVGADICGHPYTNALVGGPFRTHTIRHMVLENISDTWIWDHYKNSDVCSSRLDKLIDMPDAKVNKIVKHLIKTIDSEYDSNIFSGKNKPSEDDLKRAYTTFKHYLRMASDSGINPPIPPPSGFSEYVEEVLDSIGGTAQNIPDQFDSDNEWWEWLLAPFLAAAYALVLLVKILTAPAALIRNLAEGPLRWLLYDVQLKLYEFIMNARWQLALAGWGKPSSFDLIRAAAIPGYRVHPQRSGTATFDYPYKEVPRNINGFWLRDPSETSSLEHLKAECCPYPKMATPDIYIDDGPKYDLNQDLKLKEFATLPITVAKTIDLEKKTFTGPQFGNAVEFTQKLISNQYPNSGFDLDGDHGYGFLCWDESNAGEPTYKDEYIKE